MSPRATQALEDSRIIGCEDTRRTGKLLELLGLPKTQLVRLDEHTEARVADRLVAEVEGGSVVSVVSDAGMPGLSDPGGAIVALAHERGVTVEVVPGPFAGAVAAVASAMLDAGGRFSFEGFLPRKGAARASRIADIAIRDVATVLYESPHRVASTVADLADACGGDRRIALCRELTKMHEETWRGTLADAATHVDLGEPRGEFVLVLAPAEPPAEVTDEVLRAALSDEMEAGASQRDAAVTVSERHGVPRNRVKKLASY